MVEGQAIGINAVCKLRGFSEETRSLITDAWGSERPQIGHLWQPLCEHRHEAVLRHCLPWLSRISWPAQMASLELKGSVISGQAPSWLIFSKLQSLGDPVPRSCDPHGLWSRVDLG